jgi:hypothetical protein
VNEHRLLPHERLFLDKFAGPPPYAKVRAALQRDFGPEGIRLYVAGGANGVPAMAIWVAGLIAALFSAAVAEGLLSFGLVITILAIIRYSQAARAGRAFRASQVSRPGKGSSEADPSR